MQIFSVVNVFWMFFLLWTMSCIARLHVGKAWDVHTSFILDCTGIVSSVIQTDKYWGRWGWGFLMVCMLLSSLSSSLCLLPHPILLWQWHKGKLVFKGKTNCSGIKRNVNIIQLCVHLCWCTALPIHLINSYHISLGLMIAQHSEWCVLIFKY